MIQQFEFDQIITADGEVLTLNDYNKYFSWGFNGRGLPPSSHRTERGPYQHGDTLLGYVLRPRTINFVLRKNNCSRQAYWDARNELLDIIRPNRHYSTFDTITLRKIFPNGSKRDIAVFADSGPDFSEQDDEKWDEYSYEEVLRFVAYDPTFYDPDEKIISYSLGTTSDNLAFPISFPVQFSNTVNTEALSVVNEGTWESFPNIILNGPMTNPKIKNLTTQKGIYLNYQIGVGESVVISLTYGNKFVTDGFGNSLIGVLTTDSDLASFSFAIHPLAPNGENSIGVFADDATSASEFIFRFFARYIGI